MPSILGGDAKQNANQIAKEPAVRKPNTSQLAPQLCSTRKANIYGYMEGEK
jgi:hypothetical protein